MKSMLGSMSTLALAGLLLTGCVFFTEDTSGGSVNLSVQVPPSKDLAGKAGSPKNEIIALRADTNGGGNSFAFVRFRRALRPPFRWEVRGGRLDPGSTGVGPGFFCTELDGRDTSPLEYYGICAQPINGGLNVFVIRRGNNNVGQVFLASTDTVDFAVDADGEVMTFQARVPEGEWQTVATIGFTDPGYPLEPSVGASQMPAGTEAGFDFLRVVGNSTAPGATGEEIAAEAAGRVMDALLGAGYALDGGADDVPGADESFETAEARVAEALALAEGIEDERDRGNFTKRLGKVGKGVSKIRKKVEKGKPAKSILKPVKGLVKNAGLAALAAEGL